MRGILTFMAVVVALTVTVELYRAAEVFTPDEVYFPSDKNVSVNAPDVAEPDRAVVITPLAETESAGSTTSEQIIASPEISTETAASGVASSETTQTGDTVYATPSGSCYHRRDCPSIKRSKKVMSMSRKEAESIGLRPCKRCRP